MYFDLIFLSRCPLLTQTHFLCHCLTFLPRGSHDISYRLIILLSYPVYCGLNVNVKYEMPTVPYPLSQCGVWCIEWDLSLHCLLDVEWKQQFITWCKIKNVRQLLELIISMFDGHLFMVITQWLITYEMKCFLFISVDATSVLVTHRLTFSFTRFSLVH